MTHATAARRGHARRPAVAAALLLLALTAATAAAASAGAAAAYAAEHAAAPSAQTAAGPAAALADTAAESPSLDLVLASRRGFRGRAGDWAHVCQVVNWLRYRKPPSHVVYLLGGSASRESIRDEAGWSKSLSNRLGVRAAGWVVSSSCQTFVEDARVVATLPKGRGVALITVGLSRFNMEHTPSSVPQAAVRTTPPGAWWQHHYDGRSPLSLEAKQQLVAQWRTDHLESFNERYPGRLAELETLVQACQARGIRPVLLEMPLNVAAVGDDLDDVLTTYRQGCTDLAAKYGIPYLDLLGALSLPSDDFYDLWHLLPTGRARWQNRLSRELVAQDLL
jgi:hypothetical protein